MRLTQRFALLLRARSVDQRRAQLIRAIHGTNVLTEIDDVPTRVGFYTTRFVEASDSSEAGARAMMMVKNDPKLNDIILKDTRKLLRIFVEEIEETQHIQNNNIGYTLYREEDN